LQKGGRKLFLFTLPSRWVNGGLCLAPALCVGIAFGVCQMQYFARAEVLGSCQRRCLLPKPGQGRCLRGGCYPWTPPPFVKGGRKLQCITLSGWVVNIGLCLSRKRVQRLHLAYAKCNILLALRCWAPAQTRPEALPLDSAAFCKRRAKTSMCHLVRLGGQYWSVPGSNPLNHFPHTPGVAPAPLPAQLNFFFTKKWVAVHPSHRKLPLRHPPNTPTKIKVFARLFQKAAGGLEGSALQRLTPDFRKKDSGWLGGQRPPTSHPRLPARRAALP